MSSDHREENKEEQELRQFVEELTEIQPALRAFTAYLMSGSGSSPDVVQEINRILWKRRDQFVLGTNFRAWTFTVARNVVLGFRRKLRREGVLVFDPDLVEVLADEWQVEPDEHDQKMAALEQCLDNLNATDLKLVRTRYNNSHGEIERMAEEAGQSSGSLRLRLFRIRAALKQCIKRELEAEGGLV